MKIGDLVKRNEAAASQCRRRYKIGIVINVQKMYIKNRLSCKGCEFYKTKHKEN